jgi:hypothetical protein
MRKPRADSVLKTLHPKRQRELWQWCQSHSYEEVVARVKAEWQLETSVASLSEFYSWYPFTKQLEEFQSLAAQVRADLEANPDLHLDDEAVSKAGQAIFENLATRSLDPKLFIELRRLRQKDRDQVAQERKLKLLEAREEKLKKVLGDENLTPETKEEKLKKVFGIGI